MSKSLYLVSPEAKLHKAKLHRQKIHRGGLLQWDLKICCLLWYTVRRPSAWDSGSHNNVHQLNGLVVIENVLPAQLQEFSLLQACRLLLKIPGFYCVLVEGGHVIKMWQLYWFGMSVIIFTWMQTIKFFFRCWSLKSKQKRSALTQATSHGLDSCVPKL